MKRSIPTDCQRDKILHTVLLKSVSYHIHTGRHGLHEEHVPAEILDVMSRRDDLSKRDPTAHELPRLNYDIQNRTYIHKRQKWRGFVEALDQKTDRTIKGIDGRAKREAENEARTFALIIQAACHQVQPNVQHAKAVQTHLFRRDPIGNKGDKEETLGDGTDIHSGSSDGAIKSCRNSKAFGTDKLSIFHLKHLEPRAIEYITTLFNLSVTTCPIPAIWKSSIFIPIPKPR